MAKKPANHGKGWTPQQVQQLQLSALSAYQQDRRSRTSNRLSATPSHRFESCPRNLFSR